VVGENGRHRGGGVAITGVIGLTVTPAGAWRWELKVGVEGGVEMRVESES